MAGRSQYDVRSASWGYGHKPWHSKTAPPVANEPTADRRVFEDWSQAGFVRLPIAGLGVSPPQIALGAVAPLAAFPRAHLATGELTTLFSLFLPFSLFLLSSGLVDCELTNRLLGCQVKYSATRFKGCQTQISQEHPCLATETTESIRKAVYCQSIWQTTQLRSCFVLASFTDIAFVYTEKRQNCSKILELCTNFPSS